MPNLHIRTCKVGFHYRDAYKVVQLSKIIFLKLNRPKRCTHRENTRREESKYLECENRQLGLIAIAAYMFKPTTETFKIGRELFYLYFSVLIS